MIKIKRKSYIQRLRDGYDWTWWIIIGIFVCVIVAGVLTNKGILNFIP